MASPKHPILMFIMFLCFLILADTVSAEYVQMTGYSLDAYPGALCLDGTPGGYYHFPGIGSGKDKWYIDLQGGGWCSTFDQCVKKLDTDWGSSANWPSMMRRKTPFFDNDPQENPLMHDWNRVYFRHCDGFSFSGNVTDPVEKDGVSVHLRGWDILQSGITDMLEERNLKHATDVVVGGCSAGGMSTILHCDHWAERLVEHSSDVKVACAPDSGFFLNYNSPIRPRPTYRDVMVEGAELHHPALPSICVENEENPLECVFPERVVKHMETPIFVMQSVYDNWGRGAYKLSGGDPEEVNRFGQVVTDTVLGGVVESAASSRHGVYLDSCLRHCGGFEVEIDGFKKLEALKQWYEREMQGDNVYVQGKEYPCEGCCDASATSNPSAAPTPPPSPLPPTVNPSNTPSMLPPSFCDRYDEFGTSALYVSDLQKEDWASTAWFADKPSDDRVEIRNRGTIEMSGGVATLLDSPSLYIAKHQESEGWGDVEVTGYCNYGQGGVVRGDSGCNMRARTDHSNSKQDGCNAQFYSVQISRQTGKAAFVKEYYHDQHGVKRSNKIHSAASIFSKGLLPLDEWIGMKFVVYTTNQVNVKLELYINRGGGGESGDNWMLVHSFEDKPQLWGATSEVPPHCDYKNGDTILGSRQYCGIFNVGGIGTQVQWKDITVRNILSQKVSEVCGTPSSSPSDAPELPTSDELSSIPSPEPSLMARNDPTAIPTAAPTAAPTVAPSVTQSDLPSGVPSGAPSGLSSVVPSNSPSGAPSKDPSAAPTGAPSGSPSNGPSEVTSAVPSISPSGAPSKDPSAAPTEAPSVAPSNYPTEVPSAVPSDSPSGVPSKDPSAAPTEAPSVTPSDVPPSTLHPVISTTSTARLSFKGVNSKMTDEDVVVFEDTLEKFLQKNLESVTISEVAVVTQELTSKTEGDTNDSGGRRASRVFSRHAQEEEEAGRHLTVELAIFGEALQILDGYVSFEDAVDAVLKSEFKSLMGELAEDLPLFKEEDVPNGVEKQRLAPTSRNATVAAAIACGVVAVAIAAVVLRKVASRRQKRDGTMQSDNSAASNESLSIGSWSSSRVAGTGVVAGSPSALQTRDFMPSTSFHSSDMSAMYSMSSMCDNNSHLLDDLSDDAEGTDADLFEIDI